jgi:SlyX protein
MVNAVEPRIVDLEVRYMHLEKLLQELSDVLAQQEKTIARLVAEVTELRERLPDDGARPNEPPPHY